jgi:hypothetical protein
MNDKITFWLLVFGVAGGFIFLHNANANAPNPTANEDMGGENFGTNNPNTWN